MAIATYLIAVLLFPIVLAVWTMQSVSNGGEIQCVSRGFTECPVGLRGGEALAALVDATLGYYLATPIALVVTLPALVGLLVPSTFWVVVMRRVAGVELVSDPLHRPV